MELQIYVIIYIRSIRESNYQLDISALHALMKEYFTLDHYNYLRWLTVHLFWNLNSNMPMYTENFAKGISDLRKALLSFLPWLWTSPISKIIKLSRASIGPHVFWTEQKNKLYFVGNSVKVKSSKWSAILKNILI